MQFTKMHGAGNDFVIIRDEISNKEDYAALAKDICHRRFGIGADGLMVVKKSDVADIRMMYYNSDGSLAEMCGNGIRCFSNYVFEHRCVSSNPFTVETLAGIKTIDIGEGAPNERLIGVAMGKVQTRAAEVPVTTASERFQDEEVSVGGERYRLTSVRMGVPHTVVFVENVQAVDVDQIGKAIENLVIFPQKTNVNFTEVVNRDHMKVDTWERGAGHTLACGTGVCSAVYAAYEKGAVDAKVNVDVPGGRLIITIDEDGVYMEGHAVFICEGTYIL